MTILAAVGEQHATREIVETGFDLATAFDDELQVLHVIPRTDAEAHFEGLRRIPDFRDVGIEVEVERAESIARGLLDRALDDYDPDHVTPVGRIGDPVDEIQAQTEAVDPRYLVIGGRKRTPAGKALMGSVTQTLILDAERPVVTRMASV